MRQRKVWSPDGRQWRVGRRWVSHRVRLRGGRDGVDLGDGGDWGLGDLTDWGDWSPSAFLAGLAVAILVVLLLLVAWPVVALAIEVVIALILVMVGAVGRLLLRRPWVVEARTAGELHEVRVRGWQASGAMTDRLAEAVVRRGGEGAREVSADLPGSALSAPVTG